MAAAQVENNCCVEKMQLVGCSCNNEDDLHNWIEHTFYSTGSFQSWGMCYFFLDIQEKVLRFCGYIGNTRQEANAGYE